MLIDQAIAAFGGAEARQLLRRGYVKLKIVGELPGVAEQFGAQSLTFEAWFDLPDFERRDIYAAEDGPHLVFIRVWSGGELGKGELPVPPQSASRGPLLLRTVQSIFELLDGASDLVLVDPLLGSNADVVEARFDNAPSTRLTLDRNTHLPMRIENVLPRAIAENLGVAQETITLLSGYRQFGLATLPTVAVVQQEGKDVFRVELLAADFETPVFSEQFVIPEDTGDANG